MKTLFFDVDTQLDFLVPAGALYVPGAERIVPAIARLNQYAVSLGIPLVSTTDAHAEDDPEFSIYHPHCVAGTWGQKKPAATLVEGQIVFEKVTLNVFDNPKILDILARIGADRCIVYGVVTEICVRHAAMGLLATGRSVELVEDAIYHLDVASRERFLDEFRKAGGTITTADRVCI